MNNKSKGIVLIIISAFGFAMMSTFVKLAGDLPSFQKTFFRNIVSLAIAFILILKHKESYFGKKDSQKLLILRSVLGTLGIIFNYYAIDRLATLSDANILNKLSPFFAVIFSAIYLKEKIDFKQMLSLIIAFIGLLFVAKPTFNFTVLPTLAGIIGGVCAGGAYTTLRVLGQKEKHYTIVFYFSLFSTIAVTPFVIATYTHMKPIQLLYLLLAGVFASVGQFGITLAYKFAPAKEISIFDYTNIIFSAIISITIFGVIPDKYSVLGYCIIFLASLYTFLNEKNKIKV